MRRDELTAWLPPTLLTHWDAAVAKGYQAEPLVQDETGRLVEGHCPRCGTLVVGPVRVGKAQEERLEDGSLVRTWHTEIRRLTSARFVDVDLGGTLISLTFCEPCALALTDADLPEALAVESASQAHLAAKLGRPPVSTHDFFHAMAERLHGRDRPAPRILKVRV